MFQQETWYLIHWWTHVLQILAFHWWYALQFRKHSHKRHKFSPVDHFFRHILNLFNFSSYALLWAFCCEILWSSLTKHCMPLMYTQLFSSAMLPIVCHWTYNRSFSWISNTVFPTHIHIWHTIMHTKEFIDGHCEGWRCFHTLVFNPMDCNCLWSSFIFSSTLRALCVLH